ncbi:MAG: TraG family conjugative transposon ATPase [Daejeonella sp.]
MSRGAKLTDKIPIYKIRDDVVITKRADIAIGFKLGLKEIFTLSEQDYEDINTLFHQIIKRLPEYSVIHKQDWFLKKVYKPNNKRGDSLLGKHSEFKFLERAHVEHECYIFFIKTNKNVTGRSYSTSLFNSSLIPSDSLNERVFDDFYNTVSSIEENIKQSGFFQIKRLTNTDYYDEKTDKGLLSQYFTLSKGKALVDIDFTNGMQVGNKYCSYHTIESLTGFADHVNSSKKSEKLNTIFSFAHPVCLNLKFDHIYNQYVFKDDPKRVIKEKEIERNRLSNFSKVSSLNELNYEKLKDFIDQANSGNTVVRFHANVLTFSNSPDQLADNCIKVDSGLTDMGFKPRINKYDSKELYWGGVPGNGSDIPANLTLSIFANQAACFFNSETNYKDSNSDFGVKLCERLSGFPVHVDFIFEPKSMGLIDNKNMFILGPSGSGKSFVTNKYLSHLIDHGHHMVLVDMGRSYKRLTELYGGIHIDFDEKNPLKFNPFTLSDDVGLTDDKIENIRAVLFTLWLDDEAVKVQENIMRELIIDYYKIININKEILPCFNSFYKYVSAVYKKKKSTKSEDLKYFNYDSFLITTRQYFEGGAYDQLLNGTEKLDFTNNQLVVFELENIKDNNTLLSIYTLMIMDTYLNKLFKLPGEDILKTLLMEEAWKALMNNKMAVFLKYVVKTVRKYYGQLITVTQELDDLIGNDFVKKAIVGNSDIKILLDQSKYKDSFNDVRDMIGLTNHESDLVLSLNKNPDPERKYKEVFIKTGPLSKVYAVEVSDIEYATFTTDKDEYDVIYKYQKERGGELKPALEQFAEDLNMKRLNKIKN